MHTGAGEINEANNNRRRCGDIVMKGKVEKENRQGVNIFFSVNCNGMVPDSVDKTCQLGK